MKALLDSDWFYALPGTARMRLTDQLMTHLARVHVWGFLDKRIWDGDWEALLGEDIHEAMNKFTTLTPDHTTVTRNQRYPPQYQFSVGQGASFTLLNSVMSVSAVNDQVRRRRCVREVFRFLRRGLCGGFWWLLQRTNKGPSLMFTIGMFVATGYNEVLQMALPLFLGVFRDQAHA